MNIYYTAKDIEELAAKGIRQLELGPHASLTDFARETAEQLEVLLIEETEDLPPAQPAKTLVHGAAGVSRSYNKPRGCQPDKKGSQPQAMNVNESPSEPPSEGSAGSVNKLVDLMGKIINRGA